MFSRLKVFGLLDSARAALGRILTRIARHYEQTSSNMHGSFTLVCGVLVKFQAGQLAPPAIALC